METQLAPGFLVASPHMKDSFFEKTVIFLLEHEHEEGTFGIILNKKANITMRDVLGELGIPVVNEEIVDASSVVIEGGPVTPELGWLIHSTDWSSDKTRIFGDAVAVTASLEILHDIANGNGPSKYWFCLGYSGWGPHQLMHEIQMGSWLHVPFSADLFFNVTQDELWHAAVSKLGIDPAYFSPTMGGA